MNTVEDRIAKGFDYLEGRAPFDRSVYQLPDQAAAAEFEAALKEYPNSYRALLGLGRCRSFWPRQFEEAINLFRRASQSNSTAAEPYYQMGLVFLNADERGLRLFGASPLPDALDAFLYSLQLGYEDTVPLFYYIGRTYFRQRAFREAIQWFTRAAEAMLQGDGWEPSTFLLGAQACEELGLDADAMNWYKLYLEKGRFPVNQAEIMERITLLNNKVRRRGHGDGPVHKDG